MYIDYKDLVHSNFSFSVVTSDESTLSLSISRMEDEGEHYAFSCRAPFDFVYVAASVLFKGQPISEWKASGPRQWRTMQGANPSENRHADELCLHVPITSRD